MLVYALLLALLSAAWQGQPPAKPLTIVNSSFQQYEDGPPLPSGQKFIPGETVFFSFQVQGYQVSPDQKVRLTCQIDSTDSGGVPLAETETCRMESEVADQDKEWLPKIRHSVLVPPHALPGQYRMVARIKDEISGKEARTENLFGVEGRAVETSGALTVRNFRFFRSEDDSQPLTAAVYRPGERLWTRFDITGFKAGENNRIDVAYGISILSPAGKVLFSEPQAAAEQDSPFYPKRYVPGVASLEVQPKTPPGEYAIVVAVRDEVGGQSFESRHTFRIE